MVDGFPVDVQHQVRERRVRGRLPEVLVIGQARQPWPQLRLPVPAQLLGQVRAPVKVHAAKNEEIKAIQVLFGPLTFVVTPLAERLAPGDASGNLQRSRSVVASGTLEAENTRFRFTPLKGRPVP